MEVTVVKSLCEAGLGLGSQHTGSVNLSIFPILTLCGGVLATSSHFLARDGFFNQCRFLPTHPSLPLSNAEKRNGVGMQTKLPPPEFVLWVNDANPFKSIPIPYLLMRRLITSYVEQVNLRTRRARDWSGWEFEVGG